MGSTLHGVYHKCENKALQNFGLNCFLLQTLVLGIDLKDGNATMNCSTKAH